MGKRTKTDHAATNPKNYWPTPDREIDRLAPHLLPGSVFDEPCAGDGAIVRGLAKHGIFCGEAHDLIPRGHGIRLGNALTIPLTGRTIITNPPYAEDLLKPLLARWVGSAVCWLLLPLDMAANLWTNPYMQYVDHILPLGRVSWMHNGKGGYENSAWFRFAMTKTGLILPRAHRIQDV